MEYKGVGFILAFCSGLMNAWTFYHAQTFATVQSGNVVQIGYRLAQADWTPFWYSVGAVLAFGLGSAACGFVMTDNLKAGHRFTSAILWCECVLLTVIGILSVLKIVDYPIFALIISFIAGAQGNAFHKDHGMLYGNVAVTFVVQMAFNFLAQSFFKKDGIHNESNLMWAGVFFLVLFGFALGGAIGAFLDMNVFDNLSLFTASAAFMGLAISATRSRTDADPAPGATFV
ncbi:MAG: YoaK family protein [Acetobacter sp.]